MNLSKSPALLMVLAAVVSCGTTDTPDSPPPPPGSQMWCGDLTVRYDGYPTWNIEPVLASGEPGPGQNVCFLVTLQGPDDPVPELIIDITEEREGPVTVTYYIYSGEDASRPDWDCTFEGVDADGSANGYAVQLDPERSGCRYYDTFPIGDGAEGMMLPYDMSGTLESLRMQDGWWFALRAGFQTSVWTAQDGDRRFPQALAPFSIGTGFSHDGRAQPATYTRPAAQADPCGAEGTWTIQYGRGTIVEGQDAPVCQELVDETGTPSVAYTITDGGLRATNEQGGDWTFREVPAGSCRRISRESNPIWATVLDHATGQALVTAHGRITSPTDGVPPAQCAVIWEGRLE